MSAEPGWAALAEGRWAEARDVFAALLEDGEDPRLLEGLGTAARWLLDEQGAVAAHERAYRLYRRAGDHLGAGRMALQLSFDAYNFRSDMAVAMGWLERARRLVDEVGAPTREAGWIAALYAHKALLIDHDLAEALRRADEAAALAARCGRRGRADAEPLPARARAGEHGTRRRGDGDAGRGGRRDAGRRGRGR